MAAQEVSVDGPNIVLLNAVTVTGAGGGTALPTPCGRFGMQTKVTGAPTTVSLTLEGSLDGVNWTVLATSTSTTGDYQAAVDKPVAFIRGNLGTLTGGTAPTVTARVVALP